MRRGQARYPPTPIAGVVLVLALGVGGYLAWPLLMARLNQPEVPERPPVVMPAIPADLMPLMRELAEMAIADAIAEVNAATTPPAVPAEVDQRWLTGQYLADAGQFPTVEAFWVAIGDLVQGVRAGDWRAYHDQMEARAAAAGLAADTAAMLIERADSGFVASADAREATYAIMDRLVEASLGFHEFLVANAADIDYRPAATSTADPILEAVPNTTALRDELLEGIDRITDALAELGSLDRVSRELLTSALTARLQRDGIQ